MSLRLVKGASQWRSRPEDERVPAVLRVTAGGAVVRASGWETVSGDPVPRRIGAGTAEAPLLGAIGAVVAESFRTGGPAARYVDVSLDRRHLFSVAALPASGKQKGREVAVVIHEAPAPEVGLAEGQIIRQLGHDLRTPLTSISGAVELLQSGRLGAVQPQQERVLGIMQKGVDAMVRLIDDATAPFRRDLASGIGLRSLEDLVEDPTSGPGVQPHGGAGPRAVPAARPRRRRR